MKYIGILMGLLLWPAACMAPPTYGPYPTGGGGLSSNEVYAIALTVGGPTNGISATTATNIVNNNNAASATWATNLNAPGNASEILVTHATPGVESVVSHPQFKFETSVSQSALKIGSVDEAVGASGSIYLNDGDDASTVVLSTTNSTLYFPNHVTLGAGQSYAMINGVSHGLINADWHNSIEPIYYWGADTLSAQAWTVGANDSGLTNGRFSFMFGGLGLSWNLQQTTNALAGANYSTGAGATNVTSWMVGNNSTALRSVVSYNIDADRHIIGGTSRGLSVLGTNVHTVVGENSFEVSTNFISIGGVGKTGGLRMWDDINQVWLTFDVSDQSFNFYDYTAVFIAQTVDQFVTVRATNVIRGEGSKINAVGFTNGNVTIPGTLGVSGTTTMGTLVGTTIAGNGSGLTNIPLAGLYTNGATAGQVPTYQANATVVWSNPPAGGSGGIAVSDGAGTNTYLTNATFSGSSSTNPVFRVVNPVDSTGMVGARFGSGFLWQSSDGQLISAHTPNGFYVYTNAVFSTNVSVAGVISGNWFVGDGSGITNLSAEAISGDLSVDTLTAVTLVVDAINGNGSGLTNLNASNLASGTVADARLGNALLRTGDVMTGGLGTVGRTNRLNSLGTTIVVGDYITNGTLATVGAQQVSPATVWGGHGWKTTATAASQPVNVGFYALPVQGSTEPSAQLRFIYSINGAAFTDIGPYFTTGGAFDVVGTFTAGGPFYVKGVVRHNNPGTKVVLQFNTNNIPGITSSAGTCAITNATAGNIDVYGIASQAQVQGSRILIVNLSAETAATVTLKHDSASALQAYERFLCPGNVDFVLAANECFEAIQLYDGANYRWRIIGGH